MTREYEKLTCPSCRRKISGYIPHRGDGSGLRVVPHKAPETLRVCPISNRIVVRHAGEWIVEP